MLRAFLRRTWRKWLAVGLVGAAVIWIFVNKSVEGPVLASLGPNHGITVADLLSIALLIIAGLLVLPSRWRSVVAVVAVAIVVVGLAMSQIMPERTGLATSQPTPALTGPVTSQATPAHAARYYWSRCGNTSGRVLLTLDDWADGDPYRATRVGEYLKSRRIRAVFFLINREAENYPDIVATLRQQGHWVLNHTYSHPRLTELSDADVSWQIRNGVTSNRLRPPYGAFDSRIDSIAGSLGYRICTWTIDSLDYQYVNGSRRSTSSIRSIVRRSPRSAKASGVILGHLNTNFPDAISGIISDLHKQGLQFCRNRGPVGANMPFPASCT